MTEKVLEKGTAAWWHALALMEAAKHKEKVEGEAVTVSLDEVNAALDHIAGNIFKRLWTFLTTSRIIEEDIDEVLEGKVVIVDRERKYILSKMKK